MPEPGADRNRKLNLKAGEWVEVRSQEEILATLDEHGRLDNLPLMPEMFQYCGQKLQVYRRADKTCNYISGWSINRMTDTVHLEGVRCDGGGHDGCEASCLIFWKEAWLKRSEPDVVPAESLRPKRACSSGCAGACTVDTVKAATRTIDSQGNTVFSCQGTDVAKFSSYMHPWDLRQYVRDIRSGNLASGLAAGTAAQRLLDNLLAVVQVLRSLLIQAFNGSQSRRNRHTYPFLEGLATRTSGEDLNLQPGELVQVRSKEEIMATLNKQLRNRGLSFNIEMLPYCGGIYRVLRRVNRLIQEETGRMIDMKNAGIILEGVICRSDFHRLCPRAIYPYWRENWLRRASATAVSGQIGSRNAASAAPGLPPNRAACLAAGVEN